jgi:uracil permease
VRVVTVVLLLIAFTLLPTVLALITPAGPIPPTHCLLFALLLVLAMFVAQRCLPAIWRSSVIFWAMLFGTLVWYLLFGFPVRTSAQLPVVAQFFGGFTTHLSAAPGVLVAFLFCFLGLAVNDLGSIESVAVLLGPDNMDRRMNRGVAVTGLANIASGFLGVIGPVNFSLSPGVIMSTGCASRFTLIPTGILLAALSFSPLVLGILGGVPPVVIGATLIYILAYQMAAGLSTAAAAKEGLTLETGIVIGLSVLVGTIVGFLPVRVSMGFPAVLRPVVGNGFVMGMLTAFVLEHGIYRHRRT